MAGTKNSRTTNGAENMTAHHQRLDESLQGSCGDNGAADSVPVGKQDTHCGESFHPIASFHSPFTSKFGIPKQSGLAAGLHGTIVLEPPYRQADALRGIEGFDYLWLIWLFNANPHQSGSLLVRPPVLGGNQKVGVFASRSPFRPNPIGLSSVLLERVEWDTPQGPVLHVLGGDLMDGTPIYDIKPYVPYADCHPDARSGFTDLSKIQRLEVVIPDEVAHQFTPDKLRTLKEVLSLDPRPAYQRSSEKIYGMPFDGKDVKFRVVENDAPRGWDGRDAHSASHTYNATENDSLKMSDGAVRGGTLIVLGFSEG